VAAAFSPRLRLPKAFCSAFAALPFATDASPYKPFERSTAWQSQGTRTDAIRGNLCLGDADDRKRARGRGFAQRLLHGRPER
jgi:hypothetical protein